MAINKKTNTVYIPAALDNRVIMIDGKTDRVAGSIPVNGVRPTNVVLDEDSNTLYVANAFSASVSVIDGRNNKLIGSVLVGTPTSPINCYASPVSPPGCNSAKLNSFVYTNGVSERTGKIYALASGDNDVIVLRPRWDEHQHESNAAGPK
jgi:YVTN family beta-propeller protein